MIFALCVPDSGTSLLCAESPTMHKVIVEGHPIAVWEKQPTAHAKLFTRLATSDRQWVVIPGGDHAAFMETPRPLFLHVLSSFIDRWAK